MKVEGTHGGEIFVGPDLTSIRFQNGNFASCDTLALKAAVEKKEFTVLGGVDFTFGPDVVILTVPDDEIMLGYDHLKDVLDQVR